MTKTKDGVIELDAMTQLEGPDGQMHPGQVYLRFSVESAENGAARLTAQLPLIVHILGTWPVPRTASQKLDLSRTRLPLHELA
jgi:hypothetical protein